MLLQAAFTAFESFGFVGAVLTVLVATVAYLAKIYNDKVKEDRETLREMISVMKDVNHVIDKSNDLNQEIKNAVEAIPLVVSQMGAKLTADLSELRNRLEVIKSKL